MISVDGDSMFILYTNKMTVYPLLQANIKGVSVDIGSIELTSTLETAEYDCSVRCNVLSFVNHKIKTFKLDFILHFDKN